jgi:hypothetical protein
MSFILLEIAMRAVAPSDAIGPDPSEAPENRTEGSPEMSDWRGDGFQMQGSKSETCRRARGENARTTWRPVAKGALLEEKESN